MSGEFPVIKSAKSLVAKHVTKERWNTDNTRRIQAKCPNTRLLNITERVSYRGTDVTLEMKIKPSDINILIYVGASTHKEFSWTLYSVHLIPHTIHFTLHTAHCTLHTAHFTLHTAHCTLLYWFIGYSTVVYCNILGHSLDPWCTGHTRCHGIGRDLYK